MNGGSSRQILGGPGQSPVQALDSGRVHGFPSLLGSLSNGRTPVEDMVRGELHGNV